MITYELAKKLKDAGFPQMKEAYGSTPEEAVAMLYLALHEQQSH